MGGGSPAKKRMVLVFTIGPRAPPPSLNVYGLVDYGMQRVHQTKGTAAVPPPVPSPPLWCWRSERSSKRSGAPGRPSRPSHPHRPKLSRAPPCLFHFPLPHRFRRISKTSSMLVLPISSKSAVLVTASKFPSMKFRHFSRSDCKRFLVVTVRAWG